MKTNRAGLFVVESIHGTFSYHLAFGSNLYAPLCGTKTPMMQTSVPLDAWGTVTHLREKYCADCQRAAAGSVERLVAKSTKLVAGNSTHE